MSRKNDRLIAVGGSVRQALIDVEGLPGDQIDVIYNGIVHDAAALSAEEVLGVRQELGFSEEHLLVVQVARLDPIKDHSTALRAIQLACRQCPNLRYAIVGDGPERPTVERLIDEFGLRDRVAVLGQRRDVPRLLAAADVFLLTSLSEGIPVTVIEAMAAGLPVVSTNVGGVPEVIDKNAHTLTPAGDAVALAYLLVRLAGDRGWRETLADVGRRRAAEYFAENRMIRQYDQIYHDVIDRREWTPRVAQFSAS